MIENKFNLIDEKWIPVTDRGKVSLRTIFTDETITALGGNPVEKIAVFKLLLAIAQSAYTPENDTEWKNLGVKGLQEKVLEYLDEHYDCFWLYGEHPFLQMKEVKQAELELDEKQRKNLKMNGTFPDFFSENTTIVTEYENRDICNSDENKALFLICVLNFSFYGKQVNNNISLCKDLEKGKIANPGASLGFTNYLHTFGFLDSILESLYYNLQTLNGNWINVLGTSIGKPFWEEMPTSEKCSIAQKSKKTLIGHLVPMSRFVFFEEKRIIITEGIVYHCSKEKKKSGMFLEPWKELNISFKQEKEDDIDVIPADVTKKPWRFTTSILVNRKRETKGYNNLGLQLFIKRLEFRVNFPFILWSGGVSVGKDQFGNKIKGNDDYVESEIKLSTAIYGYANEKTEKESKFFIKLESEFKRMDEIAGELNNSIVGYVLNLSGDDYKTASHKSKKAISDTQSILPKQKFWQLCEGKFQELIDICSESSPMEKLFGLRKEIRSYALQIYDEQCPNLTARQLEAWAKNRPAIKIKEDN